MTKSANEALDRVQKNKYRHGAASCGVTQMKPIDRQADIETIRTALADKCVDVEGLKKEVIQQCLKWTDDPVCGTYDEKQHFNGRAVGICQALDYLSNQGYLRTPDKWQPIETAPDDVPILVNNVHDNKTYGAADVAVVYGDEFYLAGSCGCNDSPITPTLWRLPPTPPTGGDDE